MLSVNYCFVDTLVENTSLGYGSIEKIDFNDYYNYLYNRNQVQIASINGSKINLRNNLTYFPLNNTDGNYELISDLSSIDNLKSLSVIVFDPVSASYIGQNDEVLYSYQREATCQVNSASISLPATGKKFLAKIVDLPDTTISFNDFVSIQIAWRPGFGLLKSPIKSCTSVLKRKLITFTIEENTAPVFVDAPETLKAVVNKTLSYTFVAKDNDNSLITYSLQNASSEASLSSNGELTFKSAKIGTSKFTVVASNSVAIATWDVAINVEYPTANNDIKEPDCSIKSYPIPFTQTTTIEFSLAKKQMVRLVIFNSHGQQVTQIANGEFESGTQKLVFDGKALPDGIYMGQLQTSGGTKTVKLIKNSR
jgi:hypothetical protein